MVFWQDYHLHQHLIFEEDFSTDKLNILNWIWKNRKIYGHIVRQKH